MHDIRSRNAQQPFPRERTAEWATPGPPQSLTTTGLEPPTAPNSPIRSQQARGALCEKGWCRSRRAGRDDGRRDDGECGEARDGRASQDHGAAIVPPVDVPVKDACKGCDSTLSQVSGAPPNMFGSCIDHLRSKASSASGADDLLGLCELGALPNSAISGVWRGPS